MQSSASGGRDVGREQTQRNLATQPFASLGLHVSSANGLRPPAIRAAAAFLFDPNRGWVFYAKNADIERPVASLTKVMTLLVASGTGDLDQSVTVGFDAAALVNGANSYMGVSTGEQLTLRDLLYGLVVASGNDAAVAIADAVGGTEASFVAMMNRRAWRLGLTNTVFVTPDGLDDGNRSTAHDLAVLTAIALEQPGVEQITSTRHYTIPRTARHKAYELWSGNDLLPGGRWPYPGANGVKTGYTAGALYCMAFSARRQGHLLVGVVLGDPSAETRASDAHALLDWGFAQE
jgi:D-alanyl-D-alanine carboxypeptidase (penicillin-binding protein 5/6)